MVALVPWWGLGSLSPTRWGQLQEWGLRMGVSVLQGGASSRRALQAGRQDTCPFHPLGAHSPRRQSPEDSSAVRRLGQHSSQQARYVTRRGSSPAQPLRRHTQLWISWLLSVVVDLSTPSLGDLPCHALRSCQTDGLAGGPMAQGLPGVTELSTARPLHH